MLTFARIHDQLPASDEEAGTEALHPSHQELFVHKWSILWRSIILSSMGKTLFPYYCYIRVLDLRDFKSLLDTLDDEKYRRTISK